MQTVCPLALLPHEQAKKYGDRVVFEYKNFGGSQWLKATWKEFSDSVRCVSNALLNLGVKPQENLGVFSQNALQYMYTDFGAYGVRAATIPFYATSSEHQLQYIVNDAQIRIIFVGEQEQYDKALRVSTLCPTLDRIIAYDPTVVFAPQDTRSLHFEDFMKLGEGTPRQAEVDRLVGELNDDDIINILYTSGTTGESKGVVLSSGQYAAALKANAECVPVGDKDRVMAFLPIAHVFERGWDYLSLSVGATIIINTNPHEVLESMKQTHPTCMCAVPRFWEKVYTSVLAKIDKASVAQKMMIKSAIDISHKYNIECKACGKHPSLALTLKYNMVKNTVLAMVRKQLGLDNPNIFPTAGAVVSPEVETFVHCVGLDMVVGYGLTESLATVSCDHKGKPFTIGSVGRPIGGIDVKISEDNEVLLKGPTITRGYYKRDELNRRAFTEDGYFRTGDAGYLRDGELFLTERIKDLYKTSNGKYVAPQLVESKLLVDKFIEQVVIVAEERKFVSALVVPAYNVLEEFAHEFNIQYSGREDLCRNPLVNRMLTERIATLQQGLAGYEQVKRFTLLTEPFTVENGELTNTLKTRRNIIIKRYAEEIEKMYQD